MMHMEKLVRFFFSFREHDLANADEDIAMTPAERIALVIELRERQHPGLAQQRMERVCRIVRLNKN